jgi:hypothetical protein
MTKRHLLLCLLAAPLVAGAKCETQTLEATGPCGTDCAKDGGAAATCSYAGHTYAVGARFPETNGCNTCTCEADGQVACTLLGCVAMDGGSSAGCTYGGQHHEPGARFPALDGCNTCSCEADGQVGCTLLGCAAMDAGSSGCTYGGQHYGHAASFPALDGCNSCSCTTEGVACTDAACLPRDGGAAPVCQYGGQGYAAGANFPALDGCNTCTCGEGGVVGCTKKGCPPNDGGAAPGGLGQPCDVGATGGPHQLLWNIDATACASRICIKPGSPGTVASATDTAALCTATCDRDADCEGGAVRTDATGDKRCTSGFVCGVAAEVGTLACKKLCLCRDFFPPGPLPIPASCTATHN